MPLNHSNLRMKSAESTSSDIIKQAIWNLTPSEMFGDVPKVAPKPEQQPVKPPIKPYTKLNVSMVPDSAYSSEAIEKKSPHFSLKEPKADELATKFLENLEHNKNIVLKGKLKNYIK